MPDNNNVFQKIFKPSTRGRAWQIFILVIILAIVGFLVGAGAYYNRGADWLAGKTSDYIQFPKVKEIPFRLGLDLQGGTHLVYQADVSQIQSGGEISAIEGVRDVIERRVNIFGVSEPLVQVNKTNYRIIVELAGIKDVDEAIKMIGETPLLEFKEEGSDRDLTDEEKKVMGEYNKEAEEKAEEVLGKLLSNGDIAKLIEEYDDREDPNSEGRWIDITDEPKIIEAISDLEAGEVSDLIKVENGIVIVKLNDKRIKINLLTDEEKVEVKARHILICYQEAEGCLKERNKEEAYEKIKSLKDQASPDNFIELAIKNSDEPGSEDVGGDLDWLSRGVMPTPFEEAVFAQEIGTISDIVETQFGYHIIHKEDERKIEEYNIQDIFIATIKAADILEGDMGWENTELTGEYLKGASIQFNPNNNRPEVALEFDNEGAKIFEEITERNVNKQVAIFLDGLIISAPTVNSKITGGKAVITGNFNTPEAKLLAQRLNAGALPVPINLINQKTVGASLGKISVVNSLRAGILGIILVALFMVLFYRLPGILAVISLAIYGILVLAVFKDLPIWLSFVLPVIIISLIFYTLYKLKELNFLLMIIFVIIGIILIYYSQTAVTLTLSGLAGFILSIGMAVDANVLIFERFREEIRDGKDAAEAVEVGFKKAWSSIYDGNVSTLITCIILILISTSVVRGFAITLLLGISISMFSALVVTKNLLLIIPEKWLETGWLSGTKKRS